MTYQEFCNEEVDPVAEEKTSQLFREILGKLPHTPEGSLDGEACGKLAVDTFKGFSTKLGVLDSTDSDDVAAQLLATTVHDLMKFVSDESNPLLGGINQSFGFKVAKGAVMKSSIPEMLGGWLVSNLHKEK